MMKISLITPVLNQDKFIGKAIESVINQKGDFELEYIIMDGLSTDNTVSIIKKYDDFIRSGNFKPACKNLEFKWFSEKDTGQSQAINKGFKMATGQIINWLCGDDELTEGALENICDFFENNRDAMIASGGMIYKNIATNQRKIIDFAEFKREDMIRVHQKLYGEYILSQPSTFLKRSVLEKAGYLDEKNHLSMDYEWYLRINKFYNIKKIDAVLSITNYHEDAKSIKYKEQQAKETIRIAKSYWKEKYFYYWLQFTIYRLEAKFGLLGKYLKENHLWIYNFLKGRKLKTQPESKISFEYAKNTNNWQLKAPVALFIFNRPDTTEKVFYAIRQAKPSKLLIISDGPRLNNQDDEKKCKDAREIVKHVDWPCEVFTNYSPINLGCKIRMVSGLNWVFSIVPEAIIFEDDCVPHPAFFRFCDELLEYHRYDERIAMISGNNFGLEKNNAEYSYSFSKIPYIWGWASWKRAWKNYDANINSWPDKKNKKLLKNILHKRKFIKYWSKTLEAIYKNRINDVWDFQWTFSCWMQKSLCIIPKNNLVSNIGFGSGATHTKKINDLSGAKTFPISFPLIHPPVIPYKKASIKYPYPKEPSWIEKKKQSIKGFLGKIFRRNLLLLQNIFLNLFYKNTNKKEKSPIDLLTFYTDSHTALLNDFLLKSSVGEYNVIPIKGEQVCKTGAFNTPGWAKTSYDKLVAIRDYVAGNLNNEYFIYSDTDVIFLSGSKDILKKELRGYDALFQKDDSMFCAGFFAMKKNSACLEFLDKSISELRNRLPDFTDQDIINEIIKKERNLKYGFLSKKFANFSTISKSNKLWNGQTFKIPKDITAFHANWTIGIDNKIKLLEYVRENFKKI